MCLAVFVGVFFANPNAFWLRLFAQFSCWRRPFKKLVAFCGKFARCNGNSCNAASTYAFCNVRLLRAVQNLSSSFCGRCVPFKNFPKKLCVFRSSIIVLGEQLFYVSKNKLRLDACVFDFFRCFSFKTALPTKGFVANFCFWVEKKPSNTILGDTCFFIMRAKYYRRPYYSLIEKRNVLHRFSFFFPSSNILLDGKL